MDANLRPFFGHLREEQVTTDRMRDYRDRRKVEGRSEATCNRELSILRTAFNLGRKCTPAKVERMHSRKPPSAARESANGRPMRSGIISRASISSSFRTPRHSRDKWATRRRRCSLPTIEKL